MVMLSQLRRFKLTDKQDRHARLMDLSVALLEGDYPPVTRLYFLNSKNKRHSLPWENVESIDWPNRLIKVADLEEAQGESTDSMARQVLLGDGILDALVLDLQNRRATRANDLCLEEDNGKLLLRSADTSFSAMLRRLTEGRYGRVSREALYDWKYVEFLRGDPEAVRSEAGQHLRISRPPPGEIARLTTLLAGAVLPLATAYAVSEAFGAPKGVNLDFRRGKVFFSLFTALIVIGATLALIPNVPVMQLLVGVQVLNGILLPIILVFILLLINDKRLTGDLKNSRRSNLLAVGTLILITTAVVVMLGGQLLELFGIQLF